MNNTMDGKICMVTGANSGIGLATALGLAKRGATVVLVSRSKERGEQAVAEIKAQVPGAKLDLLCADLASMGEIRQLADDFKRKYDRLHVLINNAAIIPPSRTTTIDGIETQFAVNHLAYFLLTNLLLDMLKASAPARIINVSSSYHASGVMNFDDLQSEKSYGGMGWTTYGNTKLYNVLFTYQLARRLEGTGVTVNCLHPGVIGTNLTRGLPKPLVAIYKLFVGKPDRGAETSIYLATSPEVERVTGKYFANKKEAASAPASHDREAARRLWEISAEMAGLAQPLTAAARS
jgi:NAD(P)-dependent dehydrogenase (short-subunit alcohol dehydrogenase family)